MVEVGEDVVGGERDELASTPKYLAEEVVSVIGVGEGDIEADMTMPLTPPSYSSWRWNMGGVPGGRWR